MKTNYCDLSHHRIPEHLITGSALLTNTLQEFGVTTHTASKDTIILLLQLKNAKESNKILSDLYIQLIDLIKKIKIN